jgi:threonine dehydratase
MSDHRIRSTEIDLSVDQIELASRTIAPEFRNTPQYYDEQLCAALGKRVVVKVETASPLRSFKGRGTDFLIGQLDQASHVVCASTGNFGQGVAYAAAARGMPATVFTPTGINPSKLDRIRSFGATVIESGDVLTFKDSARDYASTPDRLFIEDGREPAIAEGAGTIAVELLAEHRPDTIVVPVGDGALITGIARWIKEFAPDTRIVGVCATGADSMLHSYRAGHVISTGRATTIAEGIQVSHPIADSVTRMRHLVDDLVAVDDPAMIDAMRLSAATLGLLLEPAGAAGLAALTTHNLPGSTFATILTGSNLHPTLLQTLTTEPTP